MTEQIIDVKKQFPHWLTATKILRLVSLVWVGLSFVVIDYYDVGQVGDSMQWKDGNTAISAGSHPAMLLWSAIAIALFTLLMVRKPTGAVEGVPPRKRRIFAFVIDFWFSLLTLSTVGALLPLSIEAVRTGHFMWHFHRNYSVEGDSLALVFSLLFMALMVLYFAFPLSRGRQTVGCFIMRTYYAFVGLTSMLTRNWDRDGQGRTWYDRKTDSTVVLVSDQ